ncbi:unnamed protein product [Candidula unifasciata]|uniref:Uncharacterized protein n=1 Tax=Candidula unifasciata TaxID=100452 RepID=A0A8S3YQI6_9EUPU|nr:unnamed protein product [Candidula unifasciata]
MVICSSVYLCCVLHVLQQQHNFLPLVDNAACKMLCFWYHISDVNPERCTLRYYISGVNIECWNERQG